MNNVYKTAKSILTMHILNKVHILIYAHNYKHILKLSNCSVE